MLIVIYIITGLAFALVVFTLIAGGVAMQSRSEDSRQRSNKWMQRRVFAQGFAILMLVILVYARNKAGG